MTRKVLRGFGSFLLIISLAPLLGLLCCSVSNATALPAGFDQPTKKQTKSFGPSPYYPNGRYKKELRCSFYSSLLVKEYDEGQKGAEWLSYVLLDPQHPKRCELSHDSDEHVLDPNEWSGYFLGVKGHLVFFTAADGTDGGIPFAVYDSNAAKKIFEDSAYESGMWNKKPANSPFNRLRVCKTATGQITLKYLRVVGTDCDLHLEGASCWEQVRSSFRIKQTTMPVCSGYEKISTRYSSSVGYPVQTVLLPKPETTTIDGPVRCWPVD